MKYKTILLVITAGVLATACSTPPVPDQTQEQAANTALNNYNNCTTTLMPYNIGDSCNTIYPSSGSTSSYNGYIFSATRGAHTEAASSTVHISEQASISQEQASRAVSDEDQAILKQAYASYLRTASAEDLADMSAQWEKLAASVSRQKP